MVDVEDIDCDEIISLSGHEVKYFLSKRGESLSVAVDVEKAYNENQSRLKILLNTDLKPNHRFLCKCCKEGDLTNAKKILQVLGRKNSSTNDVCFLHELHRREWFREHLFIATQQNLVHMVQLLIKNGADVDHPFSGSPPLCVAAENNGSSGDCTKIIQMLINAGADIDAQDGNGYTALFLSVKNKNRRLSVLKLLLEEAADRDIPENHGGRTALTHACSIGDDEMVDLLLKAIPAKGIPGASREHNEKHFGWTPLIFATRGGHVKIIERLLDNHADLENMDEHSEWTALFHAVKVHQNNALLKLIEKGACVDIHDLQNQTPLMVAVKLGFNDTLNILLDSFVANFSDDADEDEIEMTVAKLRKFVMRKDDEGNSALHIAVLHGNEEAVAAILEVGINVQQYNRNKEQPIEIAQRLGKFKVKEMIEKYIQDG